MAGTQYQTKWIADGSITLDKLGSDVSIDTPNEEMHKITSGEVTQGYFTLAHTPLNAAGVQLIPVGGPAQVNALAVGSTGETPDFTVLGTPCNRIYFKNKTPPTGLSQILDVDDVVIVTYEY